MDRTRTILRHLEGGRCDEVAATEAAATTLLVQKTGGKSAAAGEEKEVVIVNPSPFLQGGFKPVQKEFSSVECLTTFGRLPADLDGMYCKNGPNSYFNPPADAPYHWFDGDGMLHGVDIRNGRAQYTNKWVVSKRLQQDKTRGLSVYNMGALNAGDLSATLDDRVMDSNGRLYGRMNTNVVFHGNRLLALEETDLPYHISTVRLETVGQYSMHGKLDHPMTAHPKICPDTEEMFIFGHEVSPDPAKAFASFTRVGKDGVIKSSMHIPVRGPRFMHDMGLTKSFVIFIDLPALFDFESQGTPWTFDKSVPLKFGVLPRYSTNSNECVWFDCKPGMIFHTINAFDSGDKEVTMQCCRANHYTMGFNRSMDPDNWLYPYEWVLDLKTGKVQERQLCQVRCDFPTVHPKLVSKRQRFSYYTAYRPREGDDVPLYDGLVKLDHSLPVSKTNPIVIRLPDHLSCGEFSFVPKKDAKMEDAGYLITFIYNAQNDTSEFAVFDAQNVVSGDGSQSCICRLSLPQRVPYGFHGNWITRKDMDSSINC